MNAETTKDLVTLDLAIYPNWVREGDIIGVCHHFPNPSEPHWIMGPVHLQSRQDNDPPAIRHFHGRVVCPACQSDYERRENFKVCPAQYSNGRLEFGRWIFQLRKDIPK